MKKLAADTGALIRKEWVLEWRNRYALNGILLYATATVYTCYLSFRSVEPVVWNAVFWIILLFSAINAVAKSFLVESRGRQLYFYTLAHPQAIMLAKIIYNVLLMLLIAAVSLIFYVIVFDNPVADMPMYLLAVLLGCLSFASTLTMVSGIASRAGNNFSLMAILSFPVVIPLLILLIKLSKNAMDGLDRSVSADEIVLLLAINVIVIVLALLLFPYLWRD
ncbi:MAG: heme exporter protein CcmB [Solitalea sp.]